MHLPIANFTKYEGIRQTFLPFEVVKFVDQQPMGFFHIFAEICFSLTDIEIIRNDVSILELNCTNLISIESINLNSNRIEALHQQKFAKQSIENYKFEQ